MAQRELGIGNGAQRLAILLGSLIDHSHTPHTTNQPTNQPTRPALRRLNADTKKRCPPTNRKQEGPTSSLPVRSAARKSHSTVARDVTLARARWLAAARTRAVHQRRRRRRERRERRRRRRATAGAIGRDSPHWGDSPIRSSRLIITSWRTCSR